MKSKTLPPLHVSGWEVQFVQTYTASWTLNSLDRVLKKARKPTQRFSHKKNKKIKHRNVRRQRNGISVSIRKTERSGRKPHQLLTGWKKPESASKQGRTQRSPSDSGIRRITGGLGKGTKGAEEMLPWFCIWTHVHIYSQVYTHACI